MPTQRPRRNLLNSDGALRKARAAQAWVAQTGRGRTNVPPIVAPVSVPAPAEPRLAELMAALSLAVDLGNGYPLERALRDAILAVGLARELGLDGQDLSDVYYLALLEHLGCTAGSHELAAGFGGDDNGPRPVALMVDQARPHEAMAAYGEPHKSRTRRYVRPPIAWPAASDSAQGCETACSMAYTRWDGKGLPQSGRGKPPATPPNPSQAWPPTRARGGWAVRRCMRRPSPQTGTEYLLTARFCRRLNAHVTSCLVERRERR